MGKKLFLFLGLFLGLFFVLVFLSPQKASASDTGVVINEVMANPAGDDTNHEWIELANFGSEKIDLVTWQLKIYNDALATIPKRTISFSPLTLNSGDILVVTSNADFYKPCDNCLIYDGKFSSTSITNSKGKIALIDVSQGYEYDFSWTEDVGDGRSMEIIGPPEDPNYQTWQKSLIIGGTPGAENSVSKPLLPPLAPSGISPTNFQTIPFTDQVVFQWETADTQPQDFEFILFDQLNPLNIIIDEPDLTSFQYKATNLPPKTYYWQVVAANQNGETVSPFYTFTLYNPVYSNAIVINELMPDPSGDETKNEWIELYNNSDEAVDLNGWHLKDLYGSTHDFTIFNIQGTIIEPHQFLLFYRSETNITLNNDIDNVALIQPNGNILSQSLEFNQSKTDWSWARTTDGTWEWTTKPTAGGLNIISLPIEDVGGTNEENLDIPINSSPIQIKTGEFRNFENYLVTVTGTVVETSGNTFYLDDGSGKAKIYIQDATGIEKPEMHKGDIFEVTGIVNLYRETWRILPQKQDDIQLVSTVQKDTEVKISTAKKTTASTTSAKTSTSSNATARSPTDKQIASADDINSIKVKNAKSPWWVQFFKALTGLAVILLIILIVKIRQRRKFMRTLGGNFGDET